MIRFMILFMLVVGCRDYTSGVKIDEGRPIDATTANKADAVYSILISHEGKGGGCTGTAVSHDTFVFAAHCIENGNSDSGIPGVALARGKVCVSNALVQDLCTEKTFVPSNYNDGNPRKMAYDVAVSIFPEGSFKTFADVRREPVTAGLPIVLVGYSKVGLSSQNGSSKRWGRNVVDSFLSNITIVSNFRGDADGVGVSPGDSGGPIFIGCKISGVASRMSGEGAGKQNLHTNLTWPENQTWLEGLSSQGATLCGLHSNAAKCSDAARFRETNLGSNDFPCAAGGSGGAPTLVKADVSFLVTDLPGAFGDYKDQLFVSTNDKLAKDFKVCLVRSPKATSTEANCDGRPLVLEEKSRRGDRVIFRSTAALAAKPGDDVGLLAWGANGEKTVVRLTAQ
jgi:hypothetical protein